MFSQTEQWWRSSIPVYNMGSKMPEVGQQWPMVVVGASPGKWAGWCGPVPQRNKRCFPWLFVVVLGLFIPQCLFVVFLWGTLRAVYLDFKDKSCCWERGCNRSCLIWSMLRILQEWLQASQIWNRNANALPSVHVDTFMWEHLPWDS